MKIRRRFAALWFVVLGLPIAAHARVWTDSTGRYSLDANLVTFNDRSVVLQRADSEMVAIPLSQLSEGDREFLKSQEALNQNNEATQKLQTWTLRDGTQITGRVVDYAQRDMTIVRRRGKIYVNDRVLENLPEFYQKLVPQIVAHYANLQQADRRSLEAWLVRQRARPQVFRLEGVMLETENGDEYGVPFFLFSDEDLNVLKAGQDEWLSVHRGNDYTAQEDHAFLLRSLAAARQRDQNVQREIAQMQLQLQAVQAGLTSLWEVTLYPEGGMGRPQWVVVPGRDSRQATETALQRNPGYRAGPVRRVAG